MKQNKNEAKLETYRNTTVKSKQAIEREHRYSADEAAGLCLLVLTNATGIKLEH